MRSPPGRPSQSATVGLRPSSSTPAPKPSRSRSGDGKGWRIMAVRWAVAPPAAEPTQLPSAGRGSHGPWQPSDRVGGFHVNDAIARLRRAMTR